MKCNIRLDVWEHYVLCQREERHGNWHEWNHPDGDVQITWLDDAAIEQVRLARYSVKGGVVGIG